MRTSEFLTIAGAIVPGRPAVIFDGAAVTFEELQLRVNRLANAMADRLEARQVGAGARQVFLLRLVHVCHPDA